MQWETFETSGLPYGQRLQRWTRFASDTLCDLNIRPHKPSDFAASIRRMVVGEIGFIHVKSTPALAEAGTVKVGAWPAVANDALLFVLPEDNRVFRESDRLIPLTRGDLFVRDLTRSWTHDSPEPLDRLMIKIPYAVLLSRVGDPSLLAGQAFSGSRPEVAMAVDVLQSIYRALLADPTESSFNAIESLALDCVKMLSDSVIQPVVAHGQHQRAALRRDAMNYINSHLDDPCLNVSEVSRALGVGPRRLQRAFLDVGQTPAHFILTQRLERAANMLGTGSAHRTILDVAMSVGFNDASYFSRSFSKQFGLSPRDYISAGRGHTALSDKHKSLSHS